MKDDDQATADEIREAEALARAREGDSSAPAPLDALAVSGLLRHAATDGRLDPARAAAIKATLRRQVVPRRWRWPWILPPLAAMVAAGLLLISPPHPPAPPPPVALLSAQAAAARGDRQALA